MSFFSFFENPIGTLKSWGEGIEHEGSSFLTDLESGNIGGALGNLAGLATNLTPIGAAMNAFTGGALQDGIFRTVDGATHGNLQEALGGLVDAMFADTPALAVVNDILDGKPVQWIDGALGIAPPAPSNDDITWPAAPPAPAKPDAATLAGYGRVRRALTAIGTQPSSGGPVARLPAFAAGFLLTADKTDQLLPQSATQYDGAFHPPAESPSLWSMDDTLEVAGMLAFAIPEVGAVVSAGINALALLRRNIENQTPRVDPLMEYLERSFSALSEMVEKDIKDATIQNAVSLFRAKQAAVMQPFASALSGDTLPSKDILTACKDLRDNGEDWLATLMYDHTPVGKLAVPPVVSEYAFRAWLDAANTFLFCMKVGCLLAAVADEDWSDLGSALKQKSLTARIAENQESYAYFQKINALLGSAQAPFRRHLQLTLSSMHQKLARRLALIAPSVGDNSLASRQPGWQVAVDDGLTGAAGAADDFIVSAISWPRTGDEALDHLVRGASHDKPPHALWSRPGAFAVGTKDTLGRNTTAYMAMVTSHYLSAYNYDVGTDEQPTSMSEIAMAIATSWWASDTSLWQTLTRSLSLYQLQATRKGETEPFWDPLQVPTKQKAAELAAAYANTSTTSRAAATAGLRSAGQTTQTGATAIATRYTWGG
jgi:hypothetical protein